MLALPLVLAAACTMQAPVDGTAPQATDSPGRAVLYEQTLTVEMSDRSLCVGLRGRQGRQWSGRLQGCPQDWAYTARLPQGRATRIVLQPGSGGPAGATITDPAGRVFEYTGAR